MRRLAGSLILSVGLALAACGGSSDGPPPPLGRHFEESFIAAIPVDQQTDVIQAQNNYNVAQREKAKAEADIREQKLQLDVAKNEARAAKLDLDSANQREKMAQQSADMNRINEATKEKRGAELARNAADERVKYYNAYGAWLQKLLRYTQENAYWRESQYELAKARLAQKNNIAPAGFNLDNFIQQESQRKGRVDTAKAKAEGAKGAAADSRQRWLVLQGEADKTLGKKTEFPDPMSPRPVQGTDPTAGSGGTTIGGGAAGSDQTMQPTEDATNNQSGSDTGTGSGSGQ
jgi:hypothetical protein